MQHFSIRNSQGWLPGLINQLVGRQRGFVIYSRRCSEAAEGYVHRALKLAQEEQNEVVMDMRVAMLTLILGQLQGHSKSAMEEYSGLGQFGPLLEWLRERVGEKVSLAEMAEYVGCSASHFRAEFRAAMGRPAGCFFLELKMKEAGRLLRETVMPIKEVSRAVGYEELPHFYRAFRRFYGQRPLGYRQSHWLIG